MCKNNFEKELGEILKLYNDGKTFKEAVSIVKKDNKKHICIKCKYKNTGYCFKQRCKV